MPRPRLDRSKTHAHLGPVMGPVAFDDMTQAIAAVHPKATLMRRMSSPTRDNTWWRAEQNGEKTLVAHHWWEWMPHRAGAVVFYRILKERNEACLSGFHPRPLGIER